MEKLPNWIFKFSLRPARWRNRWQIIYCNNPPVFFPFAVQVATVYGYLRWLTPYRISINWNRCCNMEGINPNDGKSTAGYACWKPVSLSILCATTDPTVKLMNWANSLRVATSICYMCRVFQNQLQPRNQPKLATLLEYGFIYYPFGVLTYLSHRKRKWRKQRNKDHVHIYIYVCCHAVTHIVLVRTKIGWLKNAGTFSSISECVLMKFSVGSGSALESLWQEPGRGSGTYKKKERDIEGIKHIETNKWSIKISNFVLNYVYK